MSRSRAKANEQLELHLPTWGGRREGAGRKRASERPTVAHVVRPQVHRWNPVHVTIRFRDDVPDVRSRPAWKAIVETFRELRDASGLAIVHYSFPGNHGHLIGECEGRECLSRGLQYFCSRVARALNECFDRTGPVFAGRYHARELTTPTEVRNALRYALLNGRMHDAEAGIHHPPEWFDPRSTSAIFDGWRQPIDAPQCLKDYGTTPARTWLLQTGWKRGGLLDLDDVPGSTRELSSTARDGDAPTWLALAA
jgi:hypothetical protein